MRVLQAHPVDVEEAITLARELECTAIAWNLQQPYEAAMDAALHAGLQNHGWIQVARDPIAAEEHPEWMHAPQHHEWLRRFPQFKGQHPALVAPYIGLNTVEALAYALHKTQEILQESLGLAQVWVADLQGPPMGCGCGNPCCRSWDNAPGEKVAQSAYENPELLFPLEVFKRLRASLSELSTPPLLVPVLCPECERGVALSGVEDPDGPGGTDLCQGIPCVRPCALDYWPRLLQSFRRESRRVGLLLAAESLKKDHPVYGPVGWPKLAHRHYGSDLIPCVEREDGSSFEECLILMDAPQDCWPVEPPEGYLPALPPILCDYCPLGDEGN